MMKFSINFCAKNFETKERDILRGSIITDSYEETKSVFEAITNLEYARVYHVKNGFNNMFDKEGNLTDSTKYADIKVILLVGTDDD